MSSSTEHACTTNPCSVCGRSTSGQVGWAPGYDGGSGTGGNDDAVLPRQVLVTGASIQRADERIAALKAEVEELRKRPPRDTYGWLRDRYLRLRAAAVNILDHEPYGEEWESLRREHIDNLREALALGKRPSDDEHPED